MAEPVTLTSHHVAALLGLSIETFYRSITGLKCAHHFPGPLPGCRRYSRAAVLDWINRNGQPAPAPIAAAALEPDVAACEAQLVARARAMIAAE